MILIVQRIIPHYRVSFFEELSKKITIHLLTTAKPRVKLNLHRNSRLIILNNLNIKNFLLINPIPYFFSDKYNSIIVESNLVFSLLYFVLLPFRGHKVVIWGSWYTKNKFANFSRKLIHLFSKGAIFYADSHMKYFAKYTKNKNNLKVSRNTIILKERYFLDYKNLSCKKKYIIFIGKLVERKRLVELLKIWKEIKEYSSIKKDVKLLIIGDGEYKPILRQKILEFGLSKSVLMTGYINQDEILKKYFVRSFASISLGQVGLFAPQSMLHGVPFLCLEGSHSGGEIDNVINGKTGFQFKSINQLKSKLIKIINEDSYDLRKRTLNYAINNLNKKQMLEPFIYFDN
tara:strand:- start:715 stop:1749 length:1035 start_codon:yes stop_codon:yes gene_type:complete